MSVVKCLPQGDFGPIDASGTDPFQRTTSTTPTPPTRRPTTTTANRRPTPTTTTRRTTTTEEADVQAPAAFPFPPPPPQSASSDAAQFPLPPPLTSEEADSLPSFDLSTFFPGGSVDGGGGSGHSLTQILKDLFKPGGGNPEVLRGFSDTINDFSQSFLTKLFTLPGKSDSNFVFSPFSLHVALAMLTSGSTDNSTTQEELLGALGRQRNIQALEAKYSEILKEYETLNTTFLFGNRLWTNTRYRDAIKESFVDKLSDVYSSDLGLLPELLPEVAVNDWIENRTQGKIPELFDSLDPNLILVLTNVIFFKDAWTIPFDEETNDDKRLFNLLDGRTRANVKMMTRTSQEFRAKEITLDGILRGKKFQVVTIPYKYDFGERFEMLLLTPTGSPRDFLLLQDSLQRVSETAAVEENLFDLIDSELKKGGSDGNEEIVLTMPEFKVDAEITVDDVLKGLGIQGVFTLGEFDRISSLPLRVGQVSHKAVIEVDKEGTVGAAATGIELVPWIGTLSEPTEITIDKPFLFVIRDKVKNVPLFVGSIVDPAE